MLLWRRDNAASWLYMMMYAVWDPSRSQCTRLCETERVTAMIDDDCSAAMRIIRPTNCLDMAVMRPAMDSSM